MILSVENMSAGYGTVPVLRNVNLSMMEGDILGIIGHNGMGKTTLLRALMGLVKVGSGSIVFNGEHIDGSAPYHRSRLGIGYVPQGNTGFPGLTVVESLQLAATSESRQGNKSIDEIVSIFPNLEPLLSRQCGALSGGERQLTTIARAVIRSPRLLLLDELSEGVQPSIVEEIAEQLLVLHSAHRTTILIVDQELAFVASLADRAHVMQKGRLVKEIPAVEIAELDLMDELVA